VRILEESQNMDERKCCLTEWLIRAQWRTADEVDATEGPRTQFAALLYLIARAFAKVARCGS
jgi:hypothetical protein